MAESLLLLPAGAALLCRALAYVDFNPVRAGLVDSAREYPWSSAKAHCGDGDFAGIVEERSWSEMGYSEEWSELRSGGVDGAVELRAATYDGHAWDDESFVRTLEKGAGKPPRRPGPGPKLRAPVAAG